MSSPPIQYSGPVISVDVPWETRRHLQLIYQKLNNHVQAFGLLASAKSPTAQAVAEIISAIPSAAGGTAGLVRNQSSVTSYSTMEGDYGALIVLSDASPIAVTLTSQSPPWFCFTINLGAGTATLTPASGTISFAGNPSAVSVNVLGGYFAIVFFDGANWWAITEPIAAATFNAVTHEFLTAYNAATGAFSAAQPAFTDISGVATGAQLPTPTTGTLGGVKSAGPTTHEWVYEIDTTGAPLLSRPDYSDLTGTPTIPTVLSGASSAIGGSPLLAGQTITTTVAITGATVGMVAVCSPETYPGDGAAWDAYVSSSNTVTVRLTAVIALTPTSSVYAVRVF